MLPLLSYTDKGRGLPVVFLHGFCEQKEIWKYFRQHLHKRYRVICVDLPGFGESPLLGVENPSIAHYADALHYTLTFAGVKRCVMIGHSLGGYVALAYAKKYKKQLRGLGLFHSTALADSDEKKAARDKTVAFVEEYGVEKFVSSLFPGLFSKRSHELYAEEIGLQIQAAAATPAQAVVATALAMRDRPDSRAVVRALAVPVLYVVGKEDAAVPLAQSLEQLPDAKDAHIQILEHVAHMGMIEAKDKTLLTVKNFLRYCKKAVSN